MSVNGRGSAVFVAGELLPLGIGTVVPMAIVCLAALRHSVVRLGAIAWLPVATSLLILATAGATTADPALIAWNLSDPHHSPIRLAVIGIVVAGLLWAALAFRDPAGEPRGTVSSGQVLAAVALVGLMVLGASTHGAIDAVATVRVTERVIEVGRVDDWLLAVLAAG